MPYKLSAVALALITFKFGELLGFREKCWAKYVLHLEITFSLEETKLGQIKEAKQASNISLLF